MAEGEGHWNNVYAARQDAALTWFEEAPSLSLSVIAEHAPPGASVLDVGGGTSRLAGALLARGYGPITVLDLSAAALGANRDRLGADAARITCVAGDVTDWPDPPRVDVWHDRAAFHFLTDAADQARYLSCLDRALRPGGLAIVMTFATDGPPSCSGLPVARYDPGGLADLFDDLAPGLLVPIAARKHLHVTPMGREQAFQASVFRRAKP